MRSFAQKTGSVFNNGGYAPSIFQVSDIESAFLLSSANPLGSKVSESLYIANSLASLNTALNTLNRSHPATLDTADRLANVCYALVS